MLPVGRQHVLRGLATATMAAALFAVAIAVAVPALRRAERQLQGTTTPATASHHGGAGTPGRTARHPHRSAPAVKPHARRGVQAKNLNAPVNVGLLLALVAGTAVVVLALELARRLYRRRRRVYHAYRINLTANDQTELRSMVQAVGAMGQAVIALPSSRWWRGQSAFGLLVGYDPRDGGEVTLALVCEPQHIPALDGALLKAYPNVRVGFDFEPVYRPMQLHMGVPPALIRLRKRRAAFRPIVDIAEELEGIETVIEGLADAMVAQRTYPAAVWFCIVPSDRERARHRAQTDDRSVFYADIQIAAHNLQTCNTLSGSLQNLPGGTNTLERRPMLVRRWLYRRRFPTFTPPLRMRGHEKLFSGSELAYLMQLPSARLQAPIRRIAEPRLPAAPDVFSAVDDERAWQYDRANLPVGFEPLDAETMHRMLGRRAA